MENRAWVRRCHLRKMRNRLRDDRANRITVELAAILKGAGMEIVEINFQGFLIVRGTFIHHKTGVSFTDKLYIRPESDQYGVDVLVHDSNDEIFCGDKSETENFILSVLA